MTDATALLADLRARGIEVEPRGEKLHVTAPQGTLTPDLLAVLGAHKAELLALLAGHCCAICAGRATWPDPLADGCSLHGVTADMVAAWWKAAQAKDAHVSFCACCAGPAPSEALRCRRCEGLGGQTDQQRPP